MEIILRSTNRRVKKKMVRDFFWYDPDTQQRLHGRGGQMIFFYDKEKQKSVPRIVDSEEWIYENSYSDILKWVETHKNEVEVTHTAPNHYVAIDVNASDLTELIEDLYRHKIAYDYDDKEFKDQSADKTERKIWQNSPSKFHIFMGREENYNK